MAKKHLKYIIVKVFLVFIIVNSMSLSIYANENTEESYQAYLHLEKPNPNIVITYSGNINSDKHTEEKNDNITKNARIQFSGFIKTVIQFVTNHLHK